MDSLTQIGLGAAVGEACIGKEAGHKAWIWGAMLGLLPDLDVLALPFLDLVEATYFHRGPTHSITILLPLSIILGHFTFPRLHPKVPISSLKWSVFAFLALFTHPLLDCFTTWGTLLFWPLDLKIAWNSIFVIDPLYTLPLLIGLILAIIWKKKENKRRKAIRTALILSSAYLALTLCNKIYMNWNFRAALENEKRAVSGFQSKPTPFNNFLWLGIARTEEGFLAGYHSLLAPSRAPSFRYIPQNEELLGELRMNEKVEGLIRISRGWYAVERNEEGKLLFHDLRFGETFFWDEERVRPTFTYFIEEKKNGKVAVRRDHSIYQVSGKDLKEFMRMIGEGG